MDLGTWLWQNRLTQRDLMEFLNTSQNSTSLLVNRKHTPKLTRAIQIVELTDGEVSLRDLLSDGDKKLLEQEETKKVDTENKK